jgi:hypothetical protein
LALAVKTPAGLDAIVGDVQHDQPNDAVVAFFVPLAASIMLLAFGIANF